jgi:hypothetical protein
VLRLWRAYLQLLTDLVERQVTAAADEKAAVAAVNARLMAHLRQLGYAERIQASRERLTPKSFIGDLEGAIRGNVGNVWRI